MSSITPDNFPKMDINNPIEKVTDKDLVFTTKGERPAYGYGQVEFMQLLEGISKDNDALFGTAKRVVDTIRDKKTVNTGELRNYLQDVGLARAKMHGFVAKQYMQTILELDNPNKSNAELISKAKNLCTKIISQERCAQEAENYIFDLISNRPE
ncbi:MAG: hypothetical protein LLG04_04760 [Parachlamydia sp.]|nr:hypothetical protein [Parachlamydia sp.]